MGKNIGIKLADGTFYPIMEEGIPKKKLLELTTVQDNQTTVMVDLYRSESGTMADAEYVDTLQISELIPHGNGEPNICLTLQLDEDNRLSAEVYDPESGTSSSSNVELVTRAETEREAAPDFAIAEQDTDVTIDDEAAFADDAFPAEFADSIPEEEAEAMVEAEALGDSASPEEFNMPDEFDVPESDPESELGIESDFEQSDYNPSSDMLPENDIFPEEENGFSSVPEATESDVPEDDVFSLPDFDDMNEDASGEAESDTSNLQDEEPIISEQLPDLPEFDIPPDFDTEDYSYEADNPIGTEADESYIHESSLPDFSKFELPDFDDPVQNAGFAASTGSGLFNESDFDDPAFHDNSMQGNPGIDFSDLYDDPSESDFEQGGKKTHNTGAVVTCIICAVICILAAVLVLFFLPSNINIDISRKTPEASAQEVVASQQEPESSAPSDLTVLPPQPEPKADTIVISQTPAVVPVPPPEPEKKPEPVTYKIKWGDTLWDLADSYYNNPWLYKKIASANAIKNPDQIISGTYIVIPPK